MILEYVVYVLGLLTVSISILIKGVIYWHLLSSWAKLAGPVHSWPRLNAVGTGQHHGALWAGLGSVLKWSQLSHPAATMQLKFFSTTKIMAVAMLASPTPGTFNEDQANALAIQIAKSGLIPPDVIMLTGNQFLSGRGAIVARGNDFFGVACHGMCCCKYCEANICS